MAERRLPARLRRLGAIVMEGNVTGSSAMVAYNLLLSIFPLAVLALWIAGQVFDSASLEQAVLRDVGTLFPGPADTTIESLLDQVRRGSASLGLISLLASAWTGMSVWGAIDTAFSRIYHYEPRTWVEQKRFAIWMLGVILLFIAATVAVPTLQGVLSAGTSDLPFGLSHVRGRALAISLSVSILVGFATLAIIYRAAPNERVPWLGIWPGALGATVAITAVDAVFPLYLDNVSSISRFGSTLGFILIVLLWFYTVALIVLLGACLNAARLARRAGREGGGGGGGERGYARRSEAISAKTST